MKTHILYEKMAIWRVLFTSVSLSGYTLLNASDNTGLFLNKWIRAFLVILVKHWTFLGMLNVLRDRRRFLFALCCSIDIVDRCLLEHFLTELRLLDHLRFVKAIFCHEHPVISGRINDALFSEVCSISSPAFCSLNLKKNWSSFLEKAAFYFMCE